MTLVTIVYQVEDHDAFAAVNPLRYAHNGLRAVRVGAGDALDARDALTELLPFDYDDCAPSFKEAMERARRATTDQGDK